MSCDFGQFDIAGFPKPHAYWYRANWLQNFPAADSGRPGLPVFDVARIIDLPDHLSNNQQQQPTHQSASITLTGIATTKYVELVVDAKSFGKQPVPLTRGQVAPVTWKLDELVPSVSSALVNNNCTGTVSFKFNATGVQCKNLKKNKATNVEACARACCADEEECNTWQLDQGETSRGCWIGYVPIGSCQPPGQPGMKWVGGQRNMPPPPALFHNATLKGSDSMDAGAKVLAHHTILSPVGGPKKIMLTIDVPSPSTGTGRTLILDGTDAGLVRAAVVDAQGVLVSTASSRIHWRIVTPKLGRIIGVGNGDHDSHEWLKSSAVNAYGGLARAIVQVSQDCVSTNLYLVDQIDVDKNRRTTIHPEPAPCDTNAIVVEASSPELGSARISIQVSVLLEDSPLAVAKKTQPLFEDGFSYLDTFTG